VLRWLTPHLQLPCVLDLTVARLGALGLDGLLLDLDCTLKDHGAREIPAPVRAWARTLQANGVRLCLLSNGRTRRVAAFADGLGVPFVARAFKPLPFRCRAALDKLELPRSRAAVVGDQIFADVAAGRLAGLFTVLVRPTSPEEPWFTRIKRPVERRLLRWMAPAGQDSPCLSR
jgi:HAD superfamily phosphatase (TIGR01668 family)